MKVSELWLRELLDSSLSFSQMAERLTHAGIEVDAFEAGLEPHSGVMTLKVPPNRGDCLSLEGIARELSLLTKASFKPIIVPSPSIESTTTLMVSLEDFDLCPRYLGRVMSDVNASTETPQWLLQRLEQAGLRSISVVVDIMNYVMLELGQPLHAFDLATLKSNIHVRKAKEGEEIHLLDDRKIKLKANTLVIADQENPKAIAGIMGDMSSSVGKKTTSLFIESAYFNPVSIRLSAKQYGIKTDSSYRFERGVDSQLQARALARATELLLSIVGGKAGPITECISQDHLPKNPTIFFRYSKMNAFLGTSVAHGEVLDIFNRSSMKVEQLGEDCHVTAPSFRHDIALEVDLFEEIARIVGYGHFVSQAPRLFSVSNPIPENTVSIPKIKQSLISRGYSEMITYSFIDPKLIQLFEFQEKPYLLANPISREMALMRPSLIPAMVKTLQYNQYRQQLWTRFFEIGLCFTFNKMDELQQKSMLGGICGGLLYKEQWGVKKNPLDFYDVKQDIESLFQLLGTAHSIHFEKTEHPALHPGQAAKITQEGIEIGYLGALHPRIIRHLELQEPLFVFELEMNYCKQAKVPVFHPLSKYPAIRRDIAIVVSKEVLASELKSAILKVGGEILQDILVFDIYEGKGIEPGKKSIALGLLMQHASRTLVDEEINEIVKNSVMMLSSMFQATLRD